MTPRDKERGRMLSLCAYVMERLRDRRAHLGLSYRIIGNALGMYTTDVRERLTKRKNPGASGTMEFFELMGLRFDSVSGTEPMELLGILGLSERVPLTSLVRSLSARGPVTVGAYRCGIFLTGPEPCIT